jgi:hypothetical protein
VAVNAFDEEEVIRKYVSENRLGFKIVMGGSGEQHDLGKAYGAQAYPSNYLVDSNGVVVGRSAGFDEEALREALAKLGLE